MQNSLIAPVLVVFLHDLFTAVWIGGLIAISLTMLPAARSILGKGPQMKKLMDEIMRRQSPLVYVAIAGLTLTGLLQARGASDFDGLLSFSNAYSSLLSAKHIFVLAMIAIAIVRSLILDRGSRGGEKRTQRLSHFLLYLNMVFGVVVVFLSSLLAVPV